MIVGFLISAWGTVLASLLGASLLPTTAFAASSAPRVIDGIHCDSAEGTLLHIHQHLSILAHGQPVEIPAGVGIRYKDQCLYWIHTHATDGILHVESPQFRDFTLGQFFDIWGRPLSETDVAGVRVSKGQLRVYLDGHRYTGNLRSLPLSLHSDIVIEAGAPYAVPTPFTAWNGN